MLHALKSLRNRIDFALRSRMRLSRPLPENFSTPARDRLLQDELSKFLRGFDWTRLLGTLDSHDITCVDVGARNFVTAPVIDAILREHHVEPTIHAVEIDAFRLLLGFHNRRDYGNFYARQIQRGHFHAMDFLDWTIPVDISFMLNPFVSAGPTLAWGLPLGKLRPADMFAHCRRLLSPGRGLLILSTPSLEELEIALKLAQKTGFRIVASTEWHPTASSVQHDSRLGLALNPL